MTNTPLSPLPAGWEWCSLGDVVEFLDSKRVPVSAKEREKRIAGKPTSELFPYYGANGQVGWIDDYIFDEELVLLAEDGGYFGDRSKSIAYRIRGKTWVNNHAHVLRPKHGIELGYIHWILNHCDVMPYVRGTTRLKLNQSDAKRIPIPLPPNAEQKRIVTKIDLLFAQSRAARNALERARQQADRIDQAILVKAFKGELALQDPNDEPALALLQGIKASAQNSKTKTVRQKIL